MKKIIKDKVLLVSIILTAIFFGTGIAFLFMGLTRYGWALFVLLPVVLGMVLGALPGRKTVMAGAILCTIVLLIGLYSLGASGFLCVLMVLPIIIPLMFFGHLIAFFIKRYLGAHDTDTLPVLLLPLFVFLIAAPVEQTLTKNEESIVSVSTTKIFNYTREQVYDAIKSVDTMDAPKPFLMYLDLPVPVKCVLEKEAVGGTRTCYFKSGNLSRADFGAGTITEKITALERGKLLKMAVTDYQLIGRKWLGFREAIYYFEKAGVGGCRLTRVTTYTSVLAPRFYWQPLEQLGIRQEHDYVFANLEKDLAAKYKQPYTR